MRFLFVRMSPELKRRIAVSAAYENMTFGRYCKKYLEKWLAKEGRSGTGKLTPVEWEGTQFPMIRLRVSETGHQDARVIAARMEISANVLAIRFFDGFVKQEGGEFLALDMQRETDAHQQAQARPNDKSQALPVTEAQPNRAAAPATED